MKALATRTGVVQLRRQAARRARMAPAWRMASAFAAGRGARPGWRSDVARPPTRRAAPQLVHVQPFAAIIRRLGDSGRHRVQPLGRRPRDPPTIARPPPPRPPPSHAPIARTLQPPD